MLRASWEREREQTLAFVWTGDETAGECIWLLIPVWILEGRNEESRNKEYVQVFTDGSEDPRTFRMG